MSSFEQLLARTGDYPKRPSDTLLESTKGFLESIAASREKLKANINSGAETKRRKFKLKLPKIFEAPDAETLLLHTLKRVAEEMIQEGKNPDANNDLAVINAIIAGNEDAKTRRISSTTVAVFIGKIDELKGISESLDNLAKSTALEPEHVLEAAAPLRERMKPFAKPKEAGPAPV